MRRTGRVPSIADFEKVMVVAHMQRFSIVQAEHHVAANPSAAATAMADMSVRCPRAAARAVLAPPWSPSHAAARALLSRTVRNDRPFPFSGSPCPCAP